MDTFDLLPSLAHGRLSDSSPAEVVAAVFRARASGTLALQSPSGEVRQFYRTGDMCGSSHFSRFRTLAQVLLANDWIEALAVEDTLQEAQAKGQRHGQLLVEKGLLTPEQLRLALASQHQGNLSALLAFAAGDYEFRGTEPPPPWTREVRVDPVAVLVDAFSGEALVERRQRVLDWLGPAPVRLSVDWPGLSAKAALTAADKKAAALLSLPRPAGEFVAATKLPAPRAEGLLVALMLVGAAEPHGSASSSRPGAAPATARYIDERTIATALDDGVPAHALVSALDEQIAPAPEPDPALGLPEEIDPADLGLRELPAEESPTSSPRVRQARLSEADALARLEALDLDSLDTDEVDAPGGPQAAAGSAPEDAAAAAELAPDEEGEPLELEFGPSARGTARAQLHATPAEPFEPSSSSERSDALRRKLRAQGLRNLTGLGAEAASDDAAGDNPLELQGSVAAAQQGGPPDRSAIPWDRLTPQQRAFAEEIVSRAERAPRQDAYQRMGVAVSASTDQIRAAYLELIKKLHPDRAASLGIAGIEPHLQAAFNAVREAYDQIGTPAARQAYDGGKGGPGGSQKEESAVLVKMGDVLLRKRDFAGALAKLRRAADLDPNGDALAALAWGLLSDPNGKPTAKDEAAVLSQRALRAEGLTARTHYVAGVSLRTKDPAGAAEQFRKALALEPRHADASLELRLLEQRLVKKATPTPAGGVLSSLFGKRKSE